MRNLVTTLFLLCTTLYISSCGLVNKKTEYTDSVAIYKAIAASIANPNGNLHADSAKMLSDFTANLFASSDINVQPNEIFLDGQSIAPLLAQGKLIKLENAKVKIQSYLNSIKPKHLHNQLRSFYIPFPAITEIIDSAKQHAFPIRYMKLFCAQDNGKWSMIIVPFDKNGNYFTIKKNGVEYVYDQIAACPSICPEFDIQLGSSESNIPTYKPAVNADCNAQYDNLVTDRTKEDGYYYPRVLGRVIDTITHR